MKPYFLFPLLFLASLTACAQNAPSTWNPAPVLNDGWEIDYPVHQGLNEDTLAHLLDLIYDTEHPDFRALIVSKKGKLVVEEYFNSFGHDNLNDIRSAGKSVTAMLACKAMDLGLFSLDDPILPYFPKYQDHGNPSPEKSAITVKDVLTMSSGLAADAYEDNSPGQEWLMTQTQDYIKFIFDLPMDFETGTRFAYSSALAFLLGSLVENTSGLTLEEFARKHLFGPIGIEEFYWQKSPKGRNTGMGNLYMRGRDLAKLGQIMLDNGKWNGQQVLDEKWTALSTTKYVDIVKDDPWAYGYGFMWYIAKTEVKGKELDFYYASGNGGNKIFVIPELEMVIAMLSSAYGTRYGQGRSHIILDWVLRAAMD